MCLWNQHSVTFHELTWSCRNPFKKENLKGNIYSMSNHLNYAANSVVLISSALVCTIDMFFFIFLRPPLSFRAVKSLFLKWLLVLYYSPLWPQSSQVYHKCFLKGLLGGGSVRGSPLRTPTPLGIRGSAVWVGDLFKRPQPPHTLYSPLLVGGSSRLPVWRE